MPQSKINTVSGFSIDLSRIKAVKVNTNSKLGPINVLTVDLNLRYEYIHNPNTDEFEKQTIDDKVSIAYINYIEAKDALQNLTESWQEYLEGVKA